MLRRKAYEQIEKWHYFDFIRDFGPRYRPNDQIAEAKILSHAKMVRDL
jgi:hypothetical protein